MTPRKLFAPSPVKKGDKEEASTDALEPRRSARGATLRQSTLSGYSVSKRPRGDVDKQGIEDEQSLPSSKRARFSPSLSPSPPPPVKPREFLQVTSSSFLDSTSTPIPGVHYLHSFIPAKTAKEWYDSLVSLPQWYRPTLKMYGKEIIQSRQIIAFSKVPHLKLKYSGTQVDMHEWPLVLRKMERKCQEVIGSEVRFNHAMLNYYPDGQTYIGRHSDNCELL